MVSIARDAADLHERCGNNLRRNEAYGSIQQQRRTRILLALKVLREQKVAEGTLETSS